MTDIFKKLDIDKIIERVANYAITEAGKLKLKSEFPLTEKIEANNLLNYSFELKSYLEEIGDFNLIYFPELSEVINKSRIEGYTLKNIEILNIKKLLYNSRIIKENITKYKNLFPNIQQLIQNLNENKFLENKINNVLDDYGEIKDSASPELKKIRERIKNLQFQIQKVSEKILKNLSEKGFVQEELVTLRDGRMVIPVKTEFKRMVSGFIHAESASGQTTYIEPTETLELNNELLSLSFEEKREIERILNLLTKEIASFYSELLINQNIISIFDSAYAKAKYAIEIRGNKINFSNDSSFELIDTRHPFLVQTLGYSKTVPFNLKLDKSIKGIIISGPNAGGKTVFMKTLGVFSVLSRMGYLLPAHPDSKIPFFTKVFIDIGDEQSIDNDISTFGSHIQNLKTIYEQCNESSLVLLDEIGTGTDPTQGTALAISIIENLLKKNSFIIATTHNTALKVFAANNPKLINASMEFDLLSLEPTYRFLQGTPGSSYAFEIAKRLNLQNEIIEDAKRNLDQNQIQVESYISQLQDRVQHYSKLISELRKEREEITKLKNELNRKLSTIKNETKEIKRKALDEANQIIRTANALIEKAIKEIKESKADKQVIKSVKGKIASEKGKLNQLSQVVLSTNSFEDTLKPGDFVKLKGQETIGEIITIDYKKNQATLQIERYKVNVAIDKLEKIDSKQQKKLEKKTSKILTQVIPMRLDIRGMRANDAEKEILQYLDNATMYGLFNVEILHGKGDGVLKNLTQKILQSHPFVESFQFAPVDQGGDGITIVKLKD